ncbi:MAG TPA: carbohydrate-binding protein [Steroidobacteraceae bacterium]|jgi:hypothetical protein
MDMPDFTETEGGCFDPARISADALCKNNFQSPQAGGQVLFPFVNVTSVALHSPICTTPKSPAVTSRLTIRSGAIGSMMVSGLTIPLSATGGFAKIENVCSQNDGVSSCFAASIHDLHITLGDVNVAGTVFSNLELNLVNPAAFGDDSELNVVPAGTMAIDVSGTFQGEPVSTRVILDHDFSMSSSSGSTSFDGQFTSIVATGEFTVGELGVTTSIMSNATPQWKAGITYHIGDEVIFQDMVFRARQAHTSQNDWQPPATFALWQRVLDDSSAWTPQVIYKTGDTVLFSGSSYVCLQPHQAQPDWTPPVVPTLWKLTN